jgi:hypothetical protein
MAAYRALLSLQEGQAVTAGGNVFIFVGKNTHTKLPYPAPFILASKLHDNVPANAPHAEAVYEIALLNEAPSMAQEFAPNAHASTLLEAQAHRLVNFSCSRIVLLNLSALQSQVCCPTRQSFATACERSKKVACALCQNVEVQASSIGGGCCITKLLFYRPASP